MESWKGNGPCPCGKSSDAFADYGDHYYCFRCESYWDAKKGERVSNEMKTSENKVARQSYDLPQGEFIPIDDRRISLETCKKFGVTHVLDPEGRPTHRLYPYPDYEDLSVVAGVQVRRLPKTFRWFGDTSRVGLGGSQAFPPGCARKITVCEGAEDALAAYEINGRRWPVVWIQSSSSILQELKRNYTYLDSFEEIYLCLDGDEPGQEAIRKAVNQFEILPPEKVRIVRLPKEWDEENEKWIYPDVSDYRQQGREDEFKQHWFNAERYSPDDIIPITPAHAFAIINNHKEKETIALPFERLQVMTGGLRMGETTLLTAPPKVGKTEFLRTIEHHTWRTTEHKIGLFHIEDKPYRTVLSLAAQTVGMTFHELREQADKSIVDEAVKETFGDGRFVLVDRLGSFEPKHVLSNIRYLAKAHDCKLIVFDNVTKLFSGLELGSERQSIDALYSGIVTLSQECDVHCIVVMHTNLNTGLPRGSTGPLADCDTHIEIQRSNPDETDETLRKKRSLFVPECRWTSEDGYAGDVWFTERGRYEDWIDMFDQVGEKE